MVARGLWHCLKILSLLGVRFSPLYIATQSSSDGCDVSGVDSTPLGKYLVYSWMQDSAGTGVNMHVVCLLCQIYLWAYV